MKRIVNPSASLTVATAVLAISISGCKAHSKNPESDPDSIEFIKKAYSFMKGNIEEFEWNIVKAVQHSKGFTTALEDAKKHGQGITMSIADSSGKVNAQHLRDFLRTHKQNPLMIGVTSDVTQLDHLESLYAVVGLSSDGKRLLTHAPSGELHSIALSDLRYVKIRSVDAFPVSEIRPKDNLGARNIVGETWENKANTKDNFEVGERLGSGAFGHVFKCIVGKETKACKILLSRKSVSAYSEKSVSNHLAFKNLCAKEVFKALCAKSFHTIVSAGTFEQGRGAGALPVVISDLAQMDGTALIPHLTLSNGFETPKIIPDFYERTMALMEVMGSHVEALDFLARKGGFTHCDYRFDNVLVVPFSVQELSAAEKKVSNGATKKITGGPRIADFDLLTPLNLDLPAQGTKVDVIGWGTAAPETVTTLLNSISSDRYSVGMEMARVALGIHPISLYHVKMAPSKDYRDVMKAIYTDPAEHAAFVDFVRKQIGGLFDEQKRLVDGLSDEAKKLAKKKSSIH